MMLVSLGGGGGGLSFEGESREVHQCHVKETNSHMTNKYIALFLLE